jgi:hypothetical protein
MNRKTIPRIAPLLLVLGLIFPLSLRSSVGQPAAPTALSSGSFSALSVGAAAPGARAITNPSGPSFGALTYPDFAQIEADARARLKRGLEARTALSPYQGNLGFSQYVVKFDYAAGWTRDYTGSTPYSQTLTLIGLIDRADQDLRGARDLYGYLSVYAPVYRFRADPAYITTTLTGYPAPLCGATDKEDPDPVDPAHSGQVLDPVIDWCNFPARLRQSVREAAYLRMIFGQQFMADALGLQFSGTTLLGAENAVRQETARLRAAWYQYELAEKGIAETLQINLGSGCYVSDFFTQSEWGLLSRAIDGQETAQFELAVRNSYLDVPAQPGGPQSVRDASVGLLRQETINGYIKLVGLAGLAGLGAGAPAGAGCAMGTRPDGRLVAEMTVNLMETRRKAQEMGAGRNAFGFDVTFTPARKYRSDVALNCDTSTEAARGLWDEAKCAANQAQDLQDAEEAAGREYNQSQEKLLAEVDRIRQGIDAKITAESGCPAGDFGCVDQQIARLNTCLQVVTSTVMTAASPFDVCMDGSGINNSSARTALIDLRNVYVTLHGITTKAADIKQRIQLSQDANVTVTRWLRKKGDLETAASVAQAILDTVSCMDATSLVKNVACGISGAANLALQAAAGAVSTDAEVSVQDADNHKEIQNMLLDMSEQLIDAYGAQQQFASKLAQYQGTLDGLRDDVFQAQRQRAYFQSSPANDASFRIVRDSTRLQFASQFAKAAKLTYLAARRAEYEYAARLNASNVRYTDIYRARTAADLLAFLTDLDSVVNNMPGNGTEVDDFTISVAQNILHWTDAALAREGFTTPGAAQAERVRRFRAWVAQHTTTENGRPVLVFKFTTSLLSGGVFDSIFQTGYDRYWLLKLTRVGRLKPDDPETRGVSVNISTTEIITTGTGITSTYRTVAVTQGGMVQLRSFAGCTFDYRLIAPAVLLGQEWPSNQSAEDAMAVFKANVNDANPYTDPGFRTGAFAGRPVSATDWEIVIYAGAPSAGMADMNLQLLNDVELKFSTTHASRSNTTPPNPSDCTRIDW